MEPEVKPPRPIIVSTIHWYAAVAEPAMDKRVAAGHSRGRLPPAKRAAHLQRGVESPY